MNWKQWKRGLFIACLTAIATGLATITIGVTWTQAGMLTLALIGKDMALYLAQHPVDTIIDTEHIYKTKATTVIPQDGTPPVSTQTVQESSTTTTKLP